MQAIGAFLTEWATAERDGETGTLETLLTSDFTAVGPLGFTLTKQDWLARHRQGDLDYQAFGLDEIKARQFGEAAVATARINTRGTYQGHPIPDAVRATLTLVSHAGNWKLAVIHMSFIAAPAAPHQSPPPETVPTKGAWHEHAARPGSPGHRKLTGDRRGHRE